MAEQERIAKLCVDTDSLDWSAQGEFIQGLRHVAGVDVSFFPDGLHAVAAVVVTSFPDLEVVYEHCATFKLQVPYMPGFLAFREVPALKTMLDKVPSKWKPQAVLVDGNGVFHPRKCGAATHLGIVTGLPTIGVAKDVLQVGDINVQTARAVAEKLQGPGDWAPLVGTKDGAQPLAALLRLASGKRTVVVSGGHRVSLETAAVLTASLCKTSIPEPIRQADLRSRAAVRAWFTGRSLSKLKMSKQAGAGDLLQIMVREVPEITTLGNATTITSSNKFQSECPPADCESSKQNMKKHHQKSSKSKLVWRVKTRSAEPKEEMAQKGNLHDGNHDEKIWSFWRFFMSHLGGCCVARS
jgi:deoxyinosine 3'endonuclease (endonuclease V)